MELSRLLVLTCVLGVSAALFYARGAPARETPAPVTPAVTTASFPPAPTLTMTAPAPTTAFVAMNTTAKEHHDKTKQHKRRSHRR